MADTTNTRTQNDTLRLVMATEAALEIAALAQALLKAAPRETESYLVRGLSARIEDLSNSILDAIQDDVVPDSQIAHTVRWNA